MEQCPLDKEAAQPLYRQLAEWLGDLIHSGTFQPGHRLPSIRRLSDELSLSKTTVVVAFRLLEDWGLVEARPRSGYFVQPPARRRPRVGVGEPPSPSTMPLLAESALRSHDRTTRLMVGGAHEDVLQLWLALPSTAHYPAERLTKLLSRVVRQNPAEALGYGPSHGLERLRVQIARRAVLAGVSVSPEEVIITNGASEALMLSLRSLSKPGLRVAVASPTYNGFLGLARMCGAELVEIATDPGEGMNVDALREAVERGGVGAVFVMPNVANPTGAVMSEPRKQAIVDLADEHGLAIIEDDANAELTFDAKRPTSMRACAGDGVLWCGSFSKSLAPGFRVGWVVAGRYREKIARLKMTSSFATATPPQMAIAALLEDGGYDRHLKHLRQAYRRGVAKMCRLVEEHFPPGTYVHEPAGGYLLWVRLPLGVDAGRLAERALAEKISIGPGSMFSATGGCRDHICLNCAIKWTEQSHRAVRRLGELVEELAR